jgi:hypothetical protein
MLGGNVKSDPALLQCRMPHYPGATGARQNLPGFSAQTE